MIAIKFSGGDIYAIEANHVIQLVNTRILKEERPDMKRFLQRLGSSGEGLAYFMEHYCKWDDVSDKVFITKQKEVDKYGLNDVEKLHEYYELAIITYLPTKD